MVFNYLIVLIISTALIGFSFIPAYSAEAFTSGVSEEHADGVVAHIMERLAEKLDIEIKMCLAPFLHRHIQAFGLDERQKEGGSRCSPIGRNRRDRKNHRILL
ncbi:hypothetical protein [Desulfosarcina widdelii]|uniref:hypothetical protein n=1 Tax=Desulfosarcina widdelii TaxID=947919 RepID=UPI0012D2E486|nr:hypothetical protein [Desulfosarcina widdelii]